MRLIKMTGGLGNQMFIYALYVAMSKRHSDVRIDLSDMVHYRIHNGYELHRVFSLPCTELVINQTLKKIVEFLFFKTVLERKQRGSLEPYFGKQRWPLVYYKGFYQNEGYFRDCTDDVRRAFTFDEAKCNARTRHLLGEMEKEKCAVSFHVRRGDYMSPAVFATSGCVCGLPYYRNAIARVQELLPEAHFYVFSDDIAWARENLPLPPDTDFVDWNTGADSWQDMLLMSRCRHNVICNSTFSWWGAWLNAHPGKVVLAPSKWYAGMDSSCIVPEGWQKVPVE